MWINSVIDADRLTLDRANMVRSLPHAENAQYNASNLTAPRTTCLAGTRIEVVNTIMSWLGGEDKSPDASLFWLNGLAGIGKSTIAMTIASNAEEKGILAGSFFFSRGDEKLTNPSLVFPTLAFQLCKLDNSLISSIGQGLESNPSVANEGMQAQLRKLIIEPLNSSSMKGKRLVFVLDALDECRDNVRTAEIVNLLLVHLPLIPFVRVLLTSRPESYIERSFSKTDPNRTDPHRKFILHNVDEDVVEKDIRLYFLEKLKEISANLKDTEGEESNWPTENNIETLVKRSGRLFVYAATSMRFMEHHPRHRMQILLGIKEARGAKPHARLDELYMGIIKNAFPLHGNDRVGDDEIEIFQRVVGTLVLLHDPLSRSQLSNFTGVELNEVEFIFRHLHSIIVTPPSPDEPLQIYHPSFRDFMKDPERCSEYRYAIDVPHMEKWLTLRCLNLLMDNRLRRDILNVDEGFGTLLNEDIKGLGGLLQSAFPPEIQYACLYWSWHLNEVKHDDQEVVLLLFEFSSRFLLFWFEAMSLLKQTSRAIIAMRDAHTWTVSI